MNTDLMHHECLLQIIVHCVRTQHCMEDAVALMLADTKLAARSKKILEDAKARLLALHGLYMFDLPSRDVLHKCAAQAPTNEYSEYLHIDCINKKGLIYARRIGFYAFNSVRQVTKSVQKYTWHACEYKHILKSNLKDDELIESGVGIRPINYFLFSQQNKTRCSSECLENTYHFQGQLQQECARICDDPAHPKGFPTNRLEFYEKFELELICFKPQTKVVRLDTYACLFTNPLFRLSSIQTIPMSDPFSTEVFKDFCVANRDQILQMSRKLWNDDNVHTLIEGHMDFLCRSQTLSKNDSEK